MGSQMGSDSICEMGSDSISQMESDPILRSFGTAWRRAEREGRINGSGTTRKPFAAFVL